MSISEHHLPRSIKLFFSATFMSRLTGLLRDLLTAYLFGDHPSLAAFLVAFRLSNLFRRLLGEGPFQSAFIPHFEELKLQHQEDANRFFRQLTLLTAFILIALVALGEGALSVMQSWTPLSFDTKEIVRLTQWLLPGILFIGLYGLNISLLNCYGSFFIPNLAPAICNCIWIATLFLCREQPPALAMLSLAKWMFIGLLGQWVFTLPLTLRHASASFKEWLSIKISPTIVRLAKSYSFGLIGVGAVQVNSLIDSIFARWIDLRGPVYLWNSIRLQLLILALFGMALTGTLTPLLSRAIKAKETKRAQDLFIQGCRRILTLMIPCSFALISLGGAAVDLVFGRGHFSELAVAKTTLCLGAYGLGLLPTTLIFLFSALFFAENNFKTPMKLSLFSVIVNILLNSLFVFWLQLDVVSIALATAASSWVNCYFLYRLLTQKGWKARLLLSSFHPLFASLFASLCVLGVNALLFHPFSARAMAGFPHHTLEQLIHFLTLFAIFFGGLLLYALSFKNRELLDLLRDFFFLPSSLPK